jgi:hypothetical protein
VSEISSLDCVSAVLADPATDAEEFDPRGERHGEQSKAPERLVRDCDNARHGDEGSSSPDLDRATVARPYQGDAASTIELAWIPKNTDISWTRATTKARKRMAKIVFVSYSHVNSDTYLSRFVQDLARGVLQHLESGTVDDVAFFDAERIENGEYWKKRLADELAKCKVCVAVCTPAFRASEFCGKELRVLLDRMAAWETAAGVAQNSRSPIFPIIWVRTDPDEGALPIPPVLAPLQFGKGIASPVYKMKGLSTMYQLRKYADKRKEIVLSLAESIATAIKKIDLPPRAGLPDFDYIKSAFHDINAPVRHGVALLPLLHGGAQATPLAAGPTLMSALDAACGSQIPRRVMEQTAGLGARLEASSQKHEIALVVTTVEALTDPIWTNVVQATDAALKAPAAVIVIRSDASLAAGDDVNAMITIKSAFQSAIARQIPIDGSSARSADSLARALSETILSIRQKLVADSAHTAATDPGLSAEAAANGIPIDRKPGVVGPPGPPT